jgi:L-aspartate oxidase
MAMPCPGEVPAWEEQGLEQEADPALIWRDTRTIQHTMGRYVGLVRLGRRLTRAVHNLKHLQQDIENSCRATRLTNVLTGLRHSAQAALIVAEAAHHYRVSRGAHYREDRLPAWGSVWRYGSMGVWGRAVAESLPR